MRYDDRYNDRLMLYAWGAVAVTIGMPLSNRLGWSGAWSLLAILIAGAGIGVFVALAFILNWIFESHRSPNVPGWKWDRDLQTLNRVAPSKNITAQLEAEIIAIGPFTGKIAGLLEQPVGNYTNTREGAIIITQVFEALTSRESRRLADAFAVDPLDFNRHHLDPLAADMESLASMFEARAMDRFVVLRDLGFAFYFRPRG